MHCCGLCSRMVLLGESIISDDFLTIGLPHSEECLHNITIMHTICEKAGMPIEHRKSEGPSISLVFLRIEIDSVRGVLRLPEEKLQAIRRTIAAWRQRKACRKRAIFDWHISSCEQSSASQQDFLTEID